MLLATSNLVVLGVQLFAYPFEAPTKASNRGLTRANIARYGGYSDGIVAAVLLWVAELAELHRRDGLARPYVDAT